MAARIGNRSISAAPLGKFVGLDACRARLPPVRALGLSFPCRTTGYDARSALDEMVTGLSAFDFQ